MEEMIHETLFCLNCLAICPQFALHQTSKFHNSATLHTHVWPRILLSGNIKSRFTTARLFPRYLLFDLVECQSTCIVLSKNTGLTVHVLIGLVTIDSISGCSIWCSECTMTNVYKTAMDVTSYGPSNSLSIHWWFKVSLGLGDQMGAISASFDCAPHGWLQTTVVWQVRSAWVTHLGTSLIFAWW